MADPAAAAQAAMDAQIHIVVTSNRVFLGSFCIAFPITGILTGMAIIQAIYYCVTSQAQPVRLAMATCSAALCALLTAFETTLLFQTALANVNGEITAQHMRNWPLATQTLVTAAIALISQAYFTSICYKLYNKSRLLVGVVAVLMFVSILGSCFATYGLVNLVNTGLQANGKMYTPGVAIVYWTGVGAAMFLDVLLSVLLYRSLATYKDSSVYRHTTTILETLMRSILETYTLTAMAAVVVAILSVLSYALTGIPELQAAAGYYAVTAVMARVYAVSFLYTLTRRSEMKRNLRAGGKVTTASTINASGSKRRLSHTEHINLAKVHGSQEVDTSGIAVNREIVTTVDPAGSINELPYKAKGMHGAVPQFQVKNAYYEEKYEV